MKPFKIKHWQLLISKQLSTTVPGPTIYSSHTVQA